jgi:hypothetical protein
MIPATVEETSNDTRNPKTTWETSKKHRQRHPKPKNDMGNFSKTPATTQETLLTTPETLI